MIKSMTGFGRSEYSDGKRNITCEIRSVNHRYSDITVKMPRRYSFAEDKIKQAVKARIQRGKVDVSINVENVTENDVVIKLNQLAAKQYFDNLTDLKDQFGLSDDISLSLLANMPDVLKAVPDVDDEDELTKAILIPVEEAAKNLEDMRAIEGQRLKDDLLHKGETIKEILDKIEERSPLVVREYTVKLRDRIAELLDGAAEVPEDRILVEAAIFADKCAIDEEITRLNSHLLQLKSILTGSEGTVGKKLDFLVQEMNREANTILSKSTDLKISDRGIALKTDIEKVREQIQNIE